MAQEEVCERLHDYKRKLRDTCTMSIKSASLSTVLLLVTITARTLRRSLVTLQDHLLLFLERPYNVGGDVEKVGDVLLGHEREPKKRHVRTHR